MGLILTKKKSLFSFIIVPLNAQTFDKRLLRYSILLYSNKLKIYDIRNKLQVNSTMSTDY